MCRGHFLAACIGLLLSLHYGIYLVLATEPGYLDFDNLPETNFSCEGKVIGGYYADTETGCQMFHVCTIGQKGEITDIKFLCLNGTVFDQETRVCERLDEVDCSKSESFYDLNLELYGNNGAGYGIQPENEDIPTENLCGEEDEDECKTESPRVATKSQSEQIHASSSESYDEDTTTQAPVTPSTTSRRPMTSTSFSSTTPSPQVLQYPSSSPETIAALLALHNAFTQSLQQHSNNKDTKVSTPKLTGFVETLNPEKSTPEAETFEIKSVPSLTPQRPVSQFTSKPQNQFSIQQVPIKPQFSSPPKPSQFQSPPKPQYQSPPKQQYKPQPKPQFQQPSKQQYQNPGKPPAPLPLPAVSFNKPVQTTSERFGSIPFHHSFHINSQSNRYADQNYQDHYSDHEPQPSSQPQTEAPKQYDFDYEDDYYDEKPQTSTITPYLLHQLKVNQVRNSNQAKSSSVSHGSFVREVASQTQTKPFSVPSLRSVTNPGIAIITATSTTSSSSVKTSKPATSAIQSQKETLSTAGFINSLLHESNGTYDLHEPPQSYDDYREGDVRSDPFYKDVPKLGRRKRNLDNEISDAQSIDYGSLTKLKDLLESSLFKNNSKAILRAILNQFCSEKTNSYKNRLVSYCSPENHSSGSIELGENWKIVIPKGSSNDFLYLVKTISTFHKTENKISKILLLVNFPEEFKLLRDSVLKHMTNSELSLNETYGLNIVNNSIHHRFKRVRRNRSNISLDTNTSINAKYENVPTIKIRENKQRVKRQTSHRTYSENIGTAQEENVQPSQFNSERRTNWRRNQSAVRQISVPVEESSVGGDIQEQRRIPVRQQRPFRRRRPPDPLKQTERGEVPSVEAVRQEPSRQPLRVQEERQHAPQTPRDQTSSTIETEQENYPRVPQELPSKQETSDAARVLTTEDKHLGRPTSRRRNQGVRYKFTEHLHPEPTLSSNDDETEVSTTYPFNLKPGTQFSCDDKIKGGYYADVEAECYGYFTCSQGEINGPLLKSHFWCGPTTKFNQRSRTCQIEANVACSVSHRYFHLNKDILSLPDPEDNVKSENKQRVKRQTSHRTYSENIGIAQEENFQPSQFNSERRTNRRRNKPGVKQVSVPVEESSVGDDIQEQRRIPVRQQRPFRRRRPPDPLKQTEREVPSVEAVRQEPSRQPLRVQEERQHAPQTPRDQTSSTIETEPENYPRVLQELRSKQETSVLTTEDKRLGRPTSGLRNQGVRYQFTEHLHPEPTQSSSDDETEVSTTYPFNLKPGTQFSCDDKIKGGYYADVEADCYGYFICSQGEINGPLLKSHFWCGPTTKFNQRSRTCQIEANVACSVSHRYFHLNKDILSLPDPEDDIKDSFEPSKV